MWRRRFDCVGATKFDIKHSLCYSFVEYNISFE